MYLNCCLLHSRLLTMHMYNDVTRYDMYLEIIIFVLLKISFFLNNCIIWQQIRQSRIRLEERSRKRKLLTLEAHLSKSNNTFNIDDSRRHYRRIFAPTDKPSDNCVLAIPILSCKFHFQFSETHDHEVTEQKVPLYPSNRIIIYK